MKGKIFYRERQKVKNGAKSPRYRVMAVSGIDIKIYASHFRMKELEVIAKVSGAELVKLQAKKNNPKSKP
ncbi:MAG: hypothetical protein CSB24_01210 [Deltaproteobacteria bacterium]|nr:MAG: hypothetical protein CSB24_01210 [Deltaproteobacteria bacterium]